jgi:hypothetical protein
LLKRMLFLAFCLALNGCHTHQTGARPSIEFTKIPPAAQGGRERVDTISGRVIGARPGLQIVVYARSGPWWVQPWPDRPFIPIRADLTWSTETHLGLEYAALLVDQGYHTAFALSLRTVTGCGTRRARLWNSRSRRRTTRRTGSARLAWPLSSRCFGGCID